MILLLLLAQEVPYARDVELANDTRKPPVMGQAIEKLVKAGAEAVPAILNFVEVKGRNAMSLPFADSLGEFKDERVAALCASLVQDANFFWRPAAISSCMAFCSAGGSLSRYFLTRSLRACHWSPISLPICSRCSLLRSSWLNGPPLPRGPCSP